LIRHPSKSILFPYTTLFRSKDCCILLDKIIGNTICLGCILNHLDDILITSSEQIWAKHSSKIVKGHLVHGTKLRYLEEKTHQSLDRKSTRLNSSHVKISYAV